ncbi:MAG TPA: MBL fold metallo-hydrolase [Candidatus Lachnoclostridium stercoravium]|uniref:MBL fold metallo-hydrolase n=1 Tax=Candidatus Lachnoclostridium stercoravium TaxID=2838633 RepID=A0A9D2HJI6_9FIRM|nr:MBL fold metallo-hydrolase [Candidatus Lachnoclostridium stercoravium]
MRLTFIGADHEVTGSCHFLEIGESKILVDCGMEQGTNVYENAELPVSYAQIDYVLLTHAHIDHAGYLPLIYARGFRGQVIATVATSDLCSIMLRDSAHIQEMEAEWKNRKARRAGREETPPLYKMADALGVLRHFTPVMYGETISLNQWVKVRFTDVGHLLGSASIEIWMNEDGVEKKIVFSGDIGNKNKPIIRDPSYVESADYAVMECTYGDRLHKKNVDHVPELARIIQETLDRGGNVVIPAFAVGRTQELLYFIRHIKHEHLVTGHDNFPVYVDSPLAVEATSVFSKNLLDCYDDETKALVEKGINPISFKGLKLSITSDESKNINFDDTPKVIISAAGMCDAGRIRHHLKHNLWRPECSVVFAGYQAVGTLGRSLIDGASEVKIFGETIEVRAHIEQMEGISGHADQNGLIEWINAFKKKPEKVFLVHGDDEVCDSFAALLHDGYGFDTAAPFSGSAFDLAAGQWIKVTQGVRIQKEVQSAASRKATGVFARLLAAGERLMLVIRHNEGGANKDLAKFADQINSLCDKWDR